MKHQFRSIFTFFILISLYSPLGHAEPLSDQQITELCQNSSTIFKDFWAETMYGSCSPSVIRQVNNELKDRSIEFPIELDVFRSNPSQPEIGNFAISQNDLKLISEVRSIAIRERKRCFRISEERICEYPVSPELISSAPNLVGLAIVDSGTVRRSLERLNRRLEFLENISVEKRLQIQMVWLGVRVKYELLTHLEENFYPALKELFPNASVFLSPELQIYNFHPNGESYEFSEQWH